MKKWLSIVLVMAVMLSVGCQQAPAPTISTSDPDGTGRLAVHYIDVGQADAILIQTPDQANIMIDGGGNSTNEALVSYLQKQGVKKLDVVIATHPHEDHIGGLDEVINAFEVGSVYMPKVSHTTKTFENLLLAIKNKGLKVNTVVAGLALPLDSSQVTGEFLAPNKSEYDDLNNYSAVLKLNYGETSFMFTGDAETLSEGEILQHYSSQALKAQVLKMGHHGSNTSSSAEFLKAVKPEIAIISCGKDNDYGHPHQEIVDRLAKNNIPSYRTDLLGTIVVTSDGQQLTVNQQPTSTAPAQPDQWEQPAQIEQQPNPPVIPDAGLTDPPPPAAMEPLASSVVIQAIDKENEQVILENISDVEQNIGGWVLVSVKGDQRFTIPEGTTLPAGGQLMILSGDQAQAQQGCLVWGKQNIWNNQADPGQLLDATGQLISTYE